MEHQYRLRFVAAALALASLAAACATRAPVGPSPVPSTPTSHPFGTPSSPLGVETDLPDPLVPHVPLPTIALGARTLSTPPVVGMAPNGPYLAYLRLDQGQPTLFLINQDGSGGTYFPLPPDASLPWPNIAGLSPDGTLFAYFTGSAGSIFPDDRIQGPYDLKLNVMRLDQGTVLYSLPMISDEFPDNFIQSAQTQADHPPEGYEGASVADMAFGFHQAFIDCSRYLEWSPSGRVLAFPAQVDGLSSDLYTLDVTSGHIARLSSGPEQLCGMHWSPDGRWIVHGSANWVGMGDFITFHAARSDGAQVLSFPSSGQEFAGWLHPATFLTYQASNGVGEYNLRSISLPSGKITSLWPHPFADFATDPDSKFLIMGTFGGLDDASDPAPGTYRLDTATLASHQVSPMPIWGLVQWKSPDYTFVGTSPAGGTYALGNDLSPFALDSESLSPHPSPDGLYLALVSYRDAVSFLDASGHQLGTLSSLAPEELMWSPDSKGLFVLSADILYYVSMHDLQPTIVDSGFESNNFFPGFAWVARE